MKELLIQDHFQFFQFFHSEDFEQLVLQHGHCAFCRATQD